MVVWVLSFLFNIVTAYFNHPMHKQEETELIGQVADNIMSGLSEPEGKPLEDVIQDGVLVQPVTKTVKISARASKVKKKEVREPKK